jgi:hypothetical protein
MDKCRWRLISFVSMAVIPLGARDVPAININFVRFVQQYNLVDDQTIDIRSEFLFRNVGTWLPRHLASHCKPLILFTTLRAASCVCDLSCCVVVTYLGNAATGLFIVILFSSGNMSYTIGVILCWSKVNSCWRTQPQKLRSVHCRVQDNLPFAKWTFPHQVLSDQY